MGLQWKLGMRGGDGCGFDDDDDDNDSEDDDDDNDDSPKLESFGCMDDGLVS